MGEGMTTNPAHMGKFTTKFFTSTVEADNLILPKTDSIRAVQFNNPILHHAEPAQIHVGKRNL